jgi:hypothetical protein
MRLAGISEARYKGDFSLDEVYLAFRSAAQKYAYEADNDTFLDASARTARRDNQTVATFTIVIDRLQYSEQEAIVLFKEVLKYENLPYSYIDVIPTDSEYRVYLDAIYKPERIVEARYAFTDYTREVQQIIDTGHTPEFPKAHQIPFRMDDYDEIEKQMVKAFGYPLDSTSEEEGHGLRRTSWHIYDKNEHAWMVSMGAYRPNPHKAVIRVQKHPQFTVQGLDEAEYASQGLPRELKRRLITTSSKGLKRGIQHPDKMGTIAYQNWLEDNEEYIEELYHAIKSKLDQIDQDGGDVRAWVRRNDEVVWDVWHKFTPTWRAFLREPASTQMYHTYHSQLSKLTDIIYEYTLEQY